MWRIPLFDLDYGKEEEDAVLAVLLVMWSHFIAISPGWGESAGPLVRLLGAGHHGVDMFFVLSGFLITGILLDAKGRAGYFKVFIMRRLLDEASRDLGVSADSAAIKRFVAQKRDPREMFKTAQGISSPRQRIAAYQQLLAEYPDSDVSAQAQFMIGFVYSEEMKEYEEAERAFRVLLERYPRSELAESARWMVEHMRSDEAPPFDPLEADSSRRPAPPGATEGSTGQP